MERLEAKKINGKTYYYYSKWGWVDGKCRRLWQKYLGTPTGILKAIEGGDSPSCADVFEWGLSTALWRECRAIAFQEEVDRVCPKRNQGLSVGDYLTIAAINRAICPNSKRSMWEWFSESTLLRAFPKASPTALSSQRFWDHMDKMQGPDASSVWSSLLKRVVEHEAIDLSAVQYDGTNFYTFIDTFNVRCDIAKRGKNKQGRSNLRQVSYALFCSADGHIPLYYDLYDGNRNDAKQFPLILKKFHTFLGNITPLNTKSEAVKTTLIFDKGNNSEDNIALVDTMSSQLDFVGSLKLDQVKALTMTPNDSDQFEVCQSPNLEGTKAFRATKKIYGKDRTLIVTFNQNLFHSQWLTLQNDIQKAVEKLSALQQKLEDRIHGVIKGGKAITTASVEKQCASFLRRQHLKSIIDYTITLEEGGLACLTYRIDSKSLHDIANTYLGKGIIITSQASWTNDKIIEAYRSQFIIEAVFKEMKDRTTGSWWPMHHWTDSKIRVHGLYCTVALLIRALIQRRVEKAGLKVSLKRILKALEGIREVVNLYPPKGRGKKVRQQTVLSKTSELQQQLIDILQLEEAKTSI